MKLTRTIIAIVLSSGTLFAQHFDFGFGVGIRGGWATTEVLKTTDPSAQLKDLNNPFIIGPMVEMRLPFGFAAEVDGLYHHAEYYSPGLGPSNFSAWEIPYMAKFRFPIPVVKPFVLVGGAYRTFTRSSSGDNGFVTGLGIEMRTGRVRFSAEGRYLRWAASTESFQVAAFARDQGEVLFGVTF